MPHFLQSSLRPAFSAAVVYEATSSGHSVVGGANTFSKITAALKTGPPRKLRGPGMPPGD